MPTGAITGYIDVAQLVLYAFWIFFAGLIYYLHQENKREGYPLESDRSPYITVQGYPAIPGPKTYLLPHGGSVTVENGRPDTREIKAVPAFKFLGSPLEPTGDPMVDGVGPAAYAERADKPDLTFEGEPKIVPLRVAPEWYVEHKDPDPRGMPVLAADGQIGGTVRDVWVDKSEYIIRYLEVDLPGGDRGSVLLPFTCCRIDTWQQAVKVVSILADQFARVPRLRNPEQVTLLEEDKIMAYYAGGYLYATPERSEPLV